MLEIKELTKYYGKCLGVKDLSLSLEKGEIFGFIGPNGAGKSTTIRSILSLINKNKGQVLIDGKPFTRNDINTKRIIGYLPSEIHLYDDLTVKAMLNYHSSFYNNKNIDKRRRSLVKRFQLDEEKKIEDLSLGNLKKLGIVLTFMPSPSLVILDEPTSGLDPIMQQEFYKLLLEEKKHQTTILYSTHILSEVSRICDRVGIIKEGCLIKIETVDNLIKNNLRFITISSKDIKKIINELSASVISENDELFKLKCDLDSDRIIKVLAKYNVDYLLIEEATLEDIVLHYYN